LHYAVRDEGHFAAALRPISPEKAQAAVQAAVTEADKHGWPLNVAVVDSCGNLVTFARM
jgi:uncharacterized protein GlcG (DUF336 family)